MKIDASFCREKQLVLKLKLTNWSNTTINGLKIKFRENYFGININQDCLAHITLVPGDTQEVKVETQVNSNSDHTKIPNERPPYYLETCLASSLDIFFFSIPILFCVLFTELGSISKEDFLSGWKGINTTNDMCATFSNLHPKFRNPYQVEKRFNENNIFLVHKNENEGQSKCFFINISSIVLLFLYYKSATMLDKYLSKSRSKRNS